MTDRRAAVAASGIARWFCKTALGRFFWSKVLSMPLYEAGLAIEEGETLPESTSAPAVALATVSAPLRPVPASPQGRLVVVERKKNHLWTVVQWVALLALIVVIIGAVRVITFGLDTSNTPQTAPVAEEFPWAAASGNAERFVSAYYTVNEDAPKQRADALAGLVPAGVDVGMSDATGVTRAIDPTTVATSKVENKHFVSVAFSYWTYTKKDKEWTATRAQRLVASVPVALVDGVPVPAGAPALVPELPKGTVEQTRIEPDSALTTATTELGTSFFETLYSDRDLSPMTAPGTVLESLKIKGAEFDSVSTWSVGQGGNNRPAQAVVKIKIGSTTWTQKYNLTLVRATAGNGDRWLVAGLTAS